MGTQSSYQLGCLSRTEGLKLVLTLLEVSEREEGVVAIHTPTHWVFKNPLWVGDSTEMRTQYLPAH